MLLGRYRHNRPPCTPPELVRGFPQLDIERARLVAVGPDNAPAFTGTTTAPATLPDGVPLTAGPHAVRFVGSEETASVRLRVAGSPSGDVRVDGPAGLISVDPAVGAWLEWTADGGIQLTPRP